MINYGIVIVLFVIVQALSSTGNLSRLLMGLLVPLCVYTIASVSLNLVVGFSGELSLGHAGFMCVGAFSSALFSQVAADSIPQVPRLILAILVGAAVAALFGVIIGIPVLRLRGDYLAIVTLAFGEIIKNLINVLYIGVDDKVFTLQPVRQVFIWKPAESRSSRVPLVFPEQQPFIKISRVTFS